MKATSKPQIKLNTQLLPLLVIILLIMQLTFPYKGWQILLIGLGGVWLLSYLWVRQLAHSLTLKREMRFGWAHVGDWLEERFTLSNSALIPALWVEVIDQTTMPGYSASRVTGIDGYGENRWFTRGVCTRRGIFTLGPTILRTGDPFGIYNLTLHDPHSATLTVTPPIIPLPTIEVAPGGRAGEGRPRPTLFERTVSSAGVRDYQPGDGLHWIHWPTSARQGSLFVRQFDSLPSGDWWLFLDLDQAVQVGQGDNSTEEHSIILAASLADRGLQRTGRAVGLATHGQELVWLPPQQGDTQRQKILRALALIEPGPRPLTDLLIGSQAISTPSSSLIIITASINGDWIKALLPLIQQGTIPTILLLDPASFGNTPPINNVQAILTNLGISSYLITPDLLDQPEARPGQQGQWEWRVSLSGRAMAVNRPQDMNWKALQ